ncbi:glycine-rich protein DOT1-like [Miscanthus floridulus]|uniref:glycine-rich protein DOT1-like n=1 Tax=Miscanthus floridulus TaxID=154761 RepID=UPI00345A474C
MTQNTERDRGATDAGPGTGAGPMEVSGGVAAVVESRSARPPSEGAGVGGIGQGRGCGRRWRSVGAGTGGVGQGREDAAGEVCLRWSSAAGKGRSPPAEKSVPPELARTVAAGPDLTEHSDARAGARSSPWTTVRRDRGAGGPADGAARPGGTADGGAWPGGPADGVAGDLGARRLGGEGGGIYLARREAPPSAGLREEEGKRQRGSREEEEKRTLCCARRLEKGVYESRTLSPCAT